MGQQFIKDFPQSLDTMMKNHDDEQASITRPASVNVQQARESRHSPLSSSPSKHKDVVVNTVNTPNAQFHSTSQLLDDRSNKDVPKRGRFSETSKKNDYRIAAVLKNNLQWSRTPKRKSKSEISEQALDFMRGIMDECTHLGNFSCPVDTDLIIIIQAMQDAYIPRDNVLSLSDLWPGAEVRYIDWGHVGAFLFKQDVFR